jgi:hypothetical protein
MRTLTILFVFWLCAADADREDAPPDCCEQGHVAASSCAVAEAFVREGMRPGQVLTVVECRE